MGIQAEKEVIDEHQFVEALALTAFEVKYRDPQPSNPEKVNFCSLNNIDSIAHRENEHI